MKKIVLGKSPSGEFPPEKYPPINPSPSGRFPLKKLPPRKFSPRIFPLY